MKSDTPKLDQQATPQDQTAAIENTDFPLSSESWNAYLLFTFVMQAALVVGLVLFILWRDWEKRLPQDGLTLGLTAQETTDLQFSIPKL